MADPKELYSDFYAKKKTPIISEQSPGSGTGFVIPDADSVQLGNPKYNPNAPFSETFRNDLAKMYGSVLGFPVDLINMALSAGASGVNKIQELAGKPEIPSPASEYPFMGSRNFQDALGYNPDQKASSFGQHAVSTITTGMATSGPFGAGKKAIPLIGEILSGAGSGGGQILAEEVAPGNPYVEAVTSFLGGLAPTATANRVQAARDLFPSKLGLKELSEAKTGGLKLKDQYLRSFVDEKMKNSLEGMDPNRMTANIAEASRLESKYPGLKYTLAQRTGSPEVRSMERSVAQSSGKNLNERFSMDVANRERMAREANNIPKASITWDEALDQSRQKIQGAMAEIDSKLANLDSQMDDVVRNSGGAPQEVVGKRLRMIRDEEKKIARATVQKQFAEVDDLSKKYDAKVESAGIMGLIEQKMADPIFKFDPPTMPSVFHRAKELQVEMKMNRDSNGRFIGGSTAQVPFAEAKALREAIGSDIAAEMSSARINPRRLRSLFEVRKEIDNAMDTMGATQFPDLNAAYKQAIADYRDKYVPRFERGVNLKMSLLNSLGDMRVPDEGVVRAYFKPNGVTPIRQFKALFGDHPAAVETMENGVMNMFSKDVVKNGVVDPTRYNNFMTKYGTVLDELPNLKSKISEVGQAAESIAAQRSTLFDSAREINNGILSKTLRVEDPNKVLDKVLADPKVMGEVLKSMNGPAREALVNSAMLKAFDESKMATTEYVAIDPNKLGDWLERNRKSMTLALESTYGKKVAAEHMKNLEDIQKATAFIERTPISALSTETTPKINVDPLKKGTGISMSSVFAASRAAAAGRGGAHYFMGIFGGQLLNFMSQKQIAEMTKLALYDPDTAKALVAGMKDKELSEGVRKGLQTAASKMGYLITGGPSTSIAAAKKLPSYGASGRTQLLNPPTQSDNEESPTLNLNFEE